MGLFNRREIKPIENISSPQILKPIVQETAKVIVPEEIEKVEVDKIQPIEESKIQTDEEPIIFTENELIRMYLMETKEKLKVIDNKLDKIINYLP